MIEFKTAIERAIEKAFPGTELPPFDITRPDDQFGDFSSTIALHLARPLKRSPLEIAHTIARFLPLTDPFKKIDVVAPGYINVWLSDAALVSAMNQVSHIDPVASPETILFEYGTPNTHKMPHIGHLYNYIYGESCCRMLEAVGHQVYRDNYQGDVGLHVAKCLWGYPIALKHWGQVPSTQSERVELLQSAYQLGSAAYDKNPKHKSEIETINTKIYHHDPDIMPLWDETRAWSLAYYRWFEQSLGIKFDRWYLESDTAKIGESLVREHVGDVFEEDNSAIIFRGEPYGLHTRVFVNSRGNPTYEAKDIGLAALKLRDFPEVSHFIVATADEQSGYWSVVKKATELVFTSKFKDKQIEHLGYGMINLTSGKMSSRTGDIVTAFSLVEMVTLAMRHRLDEERHDVDADLDEVAKKVGLAAIKYSFLKTTAKKNIAFDLESSIAKEGNSGPYLLYTVARCKSVLSKAPLSNQYGVGVDINEIETSLLRWLARYSDVVHTAAQERSPHYVASYMFELAQRFNTWYARERIITEDRPKTEWRLTLVGAVMENLIHGLTLLGIETVEAL